MKENVHIETSRLSLDSVVLSDCTPTYLSWMNDIRTVEYTNSANLKHTMESLKGFIEIQEKRTNAVFLAIRVKENNKHIGNIKIDQIDRIHKAGEYGIIMGEKTEWGKGYAKEASIAIINYCFERYQLHRISLMVVEKNTPAVMLYKKLGFQVEGVQRDSFYHLANQQFYNSFRMGLLKPEWKF